MTAASTPAGVADAVTRPASSLTALLLALGAALDGRGEPSALLALLFCLALSGAVARLFWDSDSGLTFRRQCGFVGVSSLSALAISFLAWPWARHYPGPLLFLCIAMALVGPQRALTLLAGALRRVIVTISSPPANKEG